MFHPHNACCRLTGKSCILQMVPPEDKHLAQNSTEETRNHIIFAIFIIKIIQMLLGSHRILNSNYLQQYRKHPISTAIPPTTEKRTRKSNHLMKKNTTPAKAQAAAARRRRCCPCSPWSYHRSSTWPSPPLQPAALLAL
jgi:hypothetical protein